MNRAIVTILWTAIFACATVVAVRGDEEKRPEVKSVTITGNHVFDSDRLKGVMVTRPSSLFHTWRFYRSVFDNDLKSIVGFYNQNGYLDAAIVDTTVKIDTADNSVVISIGIDEGPLTRVEGLAVFNNTVLPDSVMLSKVNLHTGDPFSRTAVNEGMLAMLDLYAERGYIDASITPEIKINSETNLAVIDFNVTERYQSRIDTIQVTGLVKTRRYVVTRELQFKQGQIVQYSKLMESQQQLYLTGLFQSVFIRPVADTAAGDSASKIILVDLKEKLNSEFDVAVGYGSIDKLRGSIEILSRNLFGTGRQAGASLGASFIRRAANILYTEPHLFGSRWRTDLNLRYEFLNQPGYNLRSRGGRLTVGRTFHKHSTAQVELNYEYDVLSQVKVQAPIGDSNVNLRSLTLLVTNDTRNDLFNATRGMYISESNEVAGSFMRGSHTFARTVFDWRYFYPWGRQAILAFAFQLGWMDNFAGTVEIPLNERFYAGGPNSVRGFGYQLLGPLDVDGDPLGGKFMIVWHVVELRQVLYKFFGGVIFVDAGNVWSDITDVTFTGIRPAAGGGLRLNSPLGILRLDLGVNLDKLPGESRTKLYFSMGQAF